MHFFVAEMIKRKKYPFLVQWLFHSIALWSVITVNLFINYWYKVAYHGYESLLKPDGTYATRWEYFLSHNYYSDDNMVLLIFTFLSEANYHFVYLRKKLGFFIVSCVLTGILFTLYLNLRSPGRPDLSLTEYSAPFAFVTAYAFIYSLVREFFQRRIRDAEIIAGQKDAELSQLRAQVNPHFFFNTLNGIYGLALEEHAVRTSSAVEKLGELMRFIMNESSQRLIPVDEEIRFIENYLSLQKIRFDDTDNVKVSAHINYDRSGGTIAPAILITFIENAFQYGISMDKPSFIDLNIKIESHRLSMKLQNSFHESLKLQGHGTGIENAKRRLEIIYPGHLLSIEKDDQLFQVVRRRLK